MPNKTPASSVVGEPPARPANRRGYADWQIVVALSLIAVLAPVLVSLASGSWNVPANDDWAYRFSALQFARTGHLIFNGWGAITLVGQLLWSWPFVKLFGAHGWTALRVSAAVLGVVGIASAYYLARQVLARGRAFLAVLLLIALPGFAWSTSTFMSDIPAFAAEMACLALGAAALGRDGRVRWTLLAASMAAGVFGFAIREFALFAPVAVLLCAAAGDTPRRRWGYLGAGVAVLIACYGVYVWSSDIPNSSSLAVQPPSIGRLGDVLEAYFTLALILSPAVAYAAWRRLRWRAPWGPVVVLTVIAIGAVVIDRHLHQLFVGNYLDPAGIMGTEVLGGGRATLLPSPLWSFLGGLGLLSGGLLAWILVQSAVSGLRRRRAWRLGTPLGLLQVACVLLGAGMAVYGLTVFPSFDRYLWPLALPVVILLLRADVGRTATEVGRAGTEVGRGRTEIPRRVTGIVVLLSALLVLMSAALTVNVDNYDAARWQAGEAAVAAGVPPKWVDAGLEWVGTYAGIERLTIPPHAPAYEQWYAHMRPDFRDCGVVSGSPIPDPHVHLVKREHYELLGFTGRSTLYVYVSSAPGCSTGRQ